MFFDTLNQYKKNFEKTVFKIWISLIYDCWDICVSSLILGNNSNLIETLIDLYLRKNIIIIT